MPARVPYNIPLPTTLSGIVTPPGEQLRTNQIVRLFFQIMGTPFASAATMKLLATWTALFAATDATTIVYTPLFSGSEIAESKELQIGADTNTTYRGLPEYFGEGVAHFTGQFRGKDPVNLSSLAGLTQFSQMNTGGLSTLGVYICNNDGMLFYDNTGAAYNPLRVYNFSLRSRGTKGLNSNDTVGISFDLEPNWDATYACLIPSFDPRTF